MNRLNLDFSRQVIPIKTIENLELFLSSLLRENKDHGIAGISVFIIDHQQDGFAFLTKAGNGRFEQNIKTKVEAHVPQLTERLNESDAFFITDLTCGKQEEVQLKVTSISVLGHPVFLCYELAEEQMVSHELLQSYTNALATAINSVFNEQCRSQQRKENDLKLKIVNALSSSNNSIEVFEQTASCINEYLPIDLFDICIAAEDGEYLRSYSFTRQEGSQFKMFNILDVLEEGNIPRHTYLDAMKKAVKLSNDCKLFVGEEYDSLCMESEISRFYRNRFGLHSLFYVSIPVNSRYKVVLAWSSREENAFTCEDIQLFNTILPQISLLLNNLFCYEETERRKRKLEVENKCLIEEMNTTEGFEEVIGSSMALKQIFYAINHVAPTDSTVLILGETGTGKELFARAVHNISPRKSRVMVKVNCAALPSNLIESELFGHEKGSFTGAFEKRIGKFELADKGTIFLDEIGELSLELQAKLLRVLQEKEFERIGGNKTIKSDVRVVAATNRDLKQMVEEGKFRADLYYRLNVFPIFLPPLRERKEDIPLLANYFTQKFLKKMNKPFQCIREKAMMELMAYDFPGNIRELQNIIEHAAILSDGRPLTFSKNIFQSNGARIRSSQPLALPENANTTSRGSTIYYIEQEKEKLEKEKIMAVLLETNWRIRGEKGAARILDIKPTTLEARMKKLGIVKKFLVNQ